MADAKKIWIKANTARKKGKFTEAEALYLKALEIDPNFWDGWNNLGGLYADKLHDYAKAETIYKKCIELDPTNKWGYGNIAQVYLDTNRWELGKEFAEKALRIKVYGDALCSLGRAYLGLGRTEEALQPLLEAAQVPDWQEPHYYLALAYETLNNPTLVIRYLRNTLAIDPNFKDAKQLLEKYLNKTM